MLLYSGREVTVTGVRAGQYYDKGGLCQEGLIISWRAGTARGGRAVMVLLCTGLLCWVLTTLLH